MPAFLALQRFYRARTTDYQLRVEYLVLALLNALATGYFLCPWPTATSDERGQPVATGVARHDADRERRRGHADGGAAW